MKMNIFFFVLCSLFSLQNAQADLKVGIVTNDVTPDISEKIPLGGYGGIIRRNWPFHFYEKPIFRMFKPATGKLDPIKVKAMYLESNNKKLLFVGLDIVGVTKDIYQVIVDKVSDFGISKDQIFVSGTHSHSAPGALSKNPFWQVIAMDRFQKKYYEFYVENIIKTIKQAIDQSEGAELYKLSFETNNLINNRRGNDRPLNHQANLMLAKSTLNNTWIGGIVNFAVHGTSLGEENLFFSSDVPGAIERELSFKLKEENGYVLTSQIPEMIFVNGAEGDVSPGLNYLQLGKEFAAQAMENFSKIEPLEADWEIQTKEINLGKPRVNLSKCVEEKWMPKNVNMGIKKFISPLAQISKIKFGNLWLATWPGEATTELGNKLIAQTLAQGASQVWIWGLTNDHLSYFLTPEEYEKGGYESCSTFFGSTGGMDVLKGHASF